MVWLFRQRLFASHLIPQNSEASSGGSEKRNDEACGGPPLVVDVRKPYISARDLHGSAMATGGLWNKSSEDGKQSSRTLRWNTIESSSGLALVTVVVECLIVREFSNQSAVKQKQRSYGWLPSVVRSCFEFQYPRRHSTRARHRVHSLLLVLASLVN